MITMSRLGQMGRWGNQVFQYAFLRIFARRMAVKYQAPAWEGQRLFGFTDPPIHGSTLPRYSERWNNAAIQHSSATDYQDAWTLPVVPRHADVMNHDYQGYCQFHTSYYSWEQQFIQNLFIPVADVESRMLPALRELRTRGKTIIGLHLRRGDTGRAIFYLTPNRWYLDWLEENWGRFHDPVLFIASEEPADIKEFAKYNPVSSRDLLDLNVSRYLRYNYLQYDLTHPTQESMDWFPDWYLLQHCDVLAIGESTFSFTAAMMNQSLREAWRSRLSIQAFERIDPWNTTPLVREHLDDFPNIPDTRYTTNRQWLGAEVVPRQGGDSL